jgi:hypothetical protein
MNSSEALHHVIRLAAARGVPETAKLLGVSQARVKKMCDCNCAYPTIDELHRLKDIELPQGIITEKREGNDKAKAILRAERRRNDKEWMARTQARRLAMKKTRESMARREAVPLTGTSVTRAHR